MEGMKFNVLGCVFSLLYNVALCSEFENTDSHHEKYKQFEKEMGKPNIYYDENKDLVMLVKVYRGNSSRVIDSGMNSVGIQLKEDGNINVNEELVKFLSRVLRVEESSFTLLPGDRPSDKSLKIKGTAITAFELIDRLVAALEVTAREEPSALCLTDPPELGWINLNHLSQETDRTQTQEFDWTDKQL